MLLLYAFPMPVSGAAASTVIPPEIASRLFKNGGFIADQSLPLGGQSSHARATCRRHGRFHFEGEKLGRGVVEVDA
jgi:hypothetical protein